MGYLSSGNNNLEKNAELSVVNYVKVEVSQIPLKVVHLQTKLVRSGINLHKSLLIS